jgi:Protein of unknown function (DUF2380)
MSRTGNPEGVQDRAPRTSSGRAVAKGALTMLCATVALSCHISISLPATPLTVAVADFDFVDTSGEVADQSAEHQARVTAFAGLLRDNLGLQGEFRVLPFDCPDHPCTAASMPSADFIAAARRSGARLVVYGGIRKMSTLVQWGEIELLDLETDKVLLRRTVTFRGDSDTAYRRAALFVGDTLRDAMPKP